MHEDITLELILRYIYREVTEAEKEAVEMALAARPDLNQFYEDTLLIGRSLDEIHIEPHPTSVKIIIEESHDSSLEISN